MATKNRLIPSLAFLVVLALASCVHETVNKKTTRDYLEVVVATGCHKLEECGLKASPAYSVCRNAKTYARERSKNTILLKNPEALEACTKHLRDAACDIVRQAPLLSVCSIKTLDPFGQPMEGEKDTSTMLIPEWEASAP